MDPQPTTTLNEQNLTSQETNDLEQGNPTSSKASKQSFSHYQKSIHKDYENHIKQPLLVDQTEDIQIEDLIMTEEDITKLDQGCFAFYKVLLILAPTIMVGLSIWSSDNLMLFQYTYLLCFCILEYIAIKNKSIKQAGIAVVGFKIYILLFTIVHIIVLFMHGGDITDFLDWIIHLMGFYIIIFFGAAQVMNKLTKAFEGIDEDVVGAADAVWLSSICFFCYAAN